MHDKGRFSDREASARPRRLSMQHPEFESYEYRSPSREFTRTSNYIWISATRIFELEKSLWSSTWGLSRASTTPRKIIKTETGAVAREITWMGE